MTKPGENKSSSKEKTANVASSSAPIAANAAQHILEALEEDDEFEEFVLDDNAADGIKIGEEEGVAQWQDNWDDDDIEDDFTKSLRAELEASGAKFASAAK
mmetsp:Transcript_778/g.1754  ORF Transcript_778/g.1754 Transcript_778/m.1754 type:complete len:101 (-) Transcript_778:299-601(-)|eukprot:CAMPEP_0194324760 /NCGR_PEP_ID=MMETSP0171-20130528/28846_1 /TAXON_ID=218684 /ORGANISM="Corethron pennatum, Strain L29A3" /LENGTH=100 /DNA_ID=CAMNT_0039083733 /DNA_START=72 /DNA_END=374 /DNA_ORIENTATION=-